MMTHSIYFEIRITDWDKVEDIRDSMSYSKEFTELYLLERNGRGYQQQGGCQPFIYFPEKDDVEEGYWSIFIETGSHVGPEDELYALQWYFFTIAFRKWFEEELEETISGYRLDGEEQLKDDKWIQNEIGSFNVFSQNPTKEIKE